MATQPGMGPARPPDPRGIRDRAPVPGLAWATADHPRLPRTARDGSRRAGVLRGAERGPPGADPYGRIGRLCGESHENRHFLEVFLKNFAVESDVYPISIRQK